MTDIQRGVILLLKSAITGESYPLPDSFSLEEALPIIQTHHIAPLVYAGAANCGISTKEPVMGRLFQDYLKHMLKSERQMASVRQIFEAFDQNGIDYLPLKGCCMKALYPKPELRVMGDADILIRVAQYQRIRPIMEQLGFREGNESDHELIWDSDALHLELHKCLTAPENRDYYAYFGDGWQRAIPDSGTRHTMSREDTFLFLFTHFARHYRGGGIGCRHVTDLWVYLRANPDMDEAYIRGEMEKLHQLRFYENMLRLIDLWFGSGSEDDVLTFITEYIFSSGSWGHTETLLLSNAVMSASSSSSLKVGQFRRWVNAFFPSAREIAPRYPILKKHPWLLPLVWPYRWIRALLFGRETIRMRQQVMRVTTLEEVEKRHQALTYVGLDFHFK